MTKFSDLKLDPKVLQAVAEAKRRLTAATVLRQERLSQAEIVQPSGVSRASISRQTATLTPAGLARAASPPHPG